MSDIATEIWLDAVPGDYPDTAEERAAVDEKLKKRLNDIEDPSIRNHAAHLIRCDRAAALDRSPKRRFIAIIQRHDNREKSVVIPPAEATKDFDPGTASRIWLHPYLGGHSQLVEFLPVAEPEED